MRRFIQVCGVVLVAILIGGLFWLNHKNRQGQLEDFGGDVITSKFTLASADNSRFMRPGEKNLKLEDEGSGNHTETTIEALVVVDGCVVELERNLDENEVARQYNGHQIEVYELDEAKTGKDGGEFEIDSAPLSPTLDQVRTYLANNRSRFDYCLGG